MTSIATTLMEQWDRLLRTFSPTRNESDRPLPPVHIEIGSSVPGWVLHLVVAALALLCTGIAAPVGPVWVLGVAAAIALTAWPRPGAVQAYAVVVGIVLTVADLEPWSVRGFALIVGVHLMVTLGAISQDLPWRCRVEVQALAGPAQRFLAIQLIVQVLAVGAAAVANQHVEVVWLSVLGAVLIAAFGWMFFAALAGMRQDHYDAVRSKINRR